MSDSSQLNSAALERLCRLGGSKFALEMINLFLDYTGQKVAEARRAVLAGDRAALQQAAHPVKSSAGNVGAVRLQELAARLEREAPSSGTEQIQATLAELEETFAATRVELAAIKQKLANLPAPST